MPGCARVSQTAFYLQYRQAEDAWHFGVPDQDDPDSSNWAVVKAVGAVSVGEWVHLAGVVDTADQQLRIYVDGILRGEVPLAFAPWASDGDLHIGCAAHATGTWNALQGSIHDVRVFDGVVTAEQAGAIGATIESHWALDATGADSFGGNDLTFHGEHDWVENRDDRPESAYGLNLEGQGYAQGQQPSVRGDESFTVMAWVKLDSKDTTQALVVQAGEHRSMFKLEYYSPGDQFAFIMTGSDEDAPTYDQVFSETNPDVGEWYHVAATHDLATGRISLYVNGILEATDEAPPEPWHNDNGVIFIGASGDATTGGRVQFADAVIDDVSLYAGILDDRRIALDACGPETCNV